MIPYGTLVNTLAVIVGASVGAMLGQRLSSRYSKIAMQAISLAVVVIGLKMALAGDQVILILSSLALGGVTGEWINIERRLERLGDRLKKLAGSSSSTFVEGFVTASLIFCVGAMAIVGSIEDGIRHDPSILLAKSLLDGITGLTFAAAMGVGVIFAALPVLLYQGAITIFASYLSTFFSDPLIANLSATGGVLIMALGLNMLEATRIRTGNLLPALFYAVVFSLLFPVG